MSAFFWDVTFRRVPEEWIPTFAGIWRYHFIGHHLLVCWSRAL